MGEKGIGRLAIASIGSQVLIVSKAKLRSKEYDIVVAFINWEIFELPGINLEDIVIPVREYSHMPNAADIDSIKNEVIQSLDKLNQKELIDDKDFEKIKSSITSFKVDPHQLSLQLQQGFELTNGCGGTQFFISPVYDTIISDIEGDGNSDEATKIEKMLMGFHNTMTPDHPTPVVDISFRDYRANDGSFVSIIDKEHFFTTEEFELADHHFKGNLMSSDNSRD